jgi:transcriptional regulator
MPRTPTDLLYGTLDVLVLKTLSWGPMHGYAIAGWIGQRTAGTLAVDDAALYKALHRLEAQGHVESEWGVSENNRRAKYYQLTPAGRRQLGAESSTWRAYAAAVAAVLEAATA